MGIQTSMGTSKLELRKGSREFIVDATATLDSAAITNAYSDTKAGRVYTFTAGGKLEPGIAVGRLPFYGLSGLDVANAPDVQRDRGMPLSGVPQFAVVAFNAAVELSTTEFDSAQTYAPGDLLTAYSNTGTTGRRGKMITRTLGGTAATDPVVGIVAPAGKYTSPDGYATLAFYPHYLVGTTVTA